MAKLIVIIEDDEQLRNMLKLSFELEGYQVLGLQDGSEFEFIRPEQVDLVITDLIMPDKDGLKVIRELKTAQPSLKMVAISGGGRKGPDSYLDTALNLGVDLAIAKPFERKELIRQVNILLKD
jgi:DNA-binding response OmpR family regulator